MPNDPPSSPLFFTDHRDVKACLNRGDRLVLARRRVAASNSDYELIKAFANRAEAKNHATTYDLNRDKYVVLLQVTDTGLEDIAF